MVFGGLVLFDIGNGDGFSDCPLLSSVFAGVIARRRVADWFGEIGQLVSASAFCLRIGYIRLGSFEKKSGPFP